MRLALVVLLMLIVPVVAAAARRGPDVSGKVPPHNNRHRRPHFYLMGGYPYGWASVGMLDSDLAKVQTEYDRNVDLQPQPQPRTVKQGTPQHASLLLLLLRLGCATQLHFLTLCLCSFTGNNVGSHASDQCQETVARRQGRRPPATTAASAWLVCEKERRQETPRVAGHG
jgi:hypothetical protein